MTLTFNKNIRILTNVNVINDNDLDKAMIIAKQPKRNIEI